jgi:tape measure domain-containing protein
MSRNLGTLTLDLVARIDGFNRNMQTATQTVERSVDRMNSAVNTATGTLKHFLALSGTYFSVEGLLHAADGYTEIANKIRLVTDTTAEFKTAMADTFQIAQQTRTSWADTAQVYQRFMQISDSLGLSQERVAKITGTVSKAIAISGTSAVSAQAALMQFGQALGSGVLRGEEFNSVAEQAPALMFALAEGLGVTTAQLRAMANDGKLTGDVLVQSLEKVKDSVDKDFLTAVPTLSSSFTALSDAVKEFVGSNASGAMGEFANGILLVANNLNLIGSAGAAAAIGYITKATIEATAAGYAKVTQTLASIRADQVAVALRQRVAVAEYNAADAELARARASIVAATTDAEMTAALAARTLAVERSAAASMELTAANYALSRSAGVATVATRGLITMLISPLGLALTVAAAAFFYFQDSTKAADDSVSDLTDSIKDLTVKYKELDLAQVQVERGKLTEQMNEAASAIDKARFKFDIYIATQDALFKVSTKSSMALQELSSKVSKGEISTQQAVLEASKFKDITTEQIGKFAQFTQEVDKNNGVIAVNKERLSVLNVVSKNKIALTDEQNKQLSVQKTLTDNLTSSYTTHKTSMENVLGSSIEMSRANGNSAQSILYLENVLSEYQSGAISATDAAKIFAQSTYIPQSQRDTITDTAKRTDNLKSELNSAEGKLAQMNKQLAAGETAAENQAAAYDKVAQALKGVSKELDKVNADSIAGIQENAFKSKLLAMGKFTQNQIDAMAKVAKAINYNVDLMNTPEFKNAVKLAVSGANLEDKLDKAKDKAKKQDNPAKEQREPLSGARLVGLSGNTGRSTGAHLDIRVSGGGRRLNDAELARFQAGGKQLSAYTKTSEYGSRVHPVTGKRHTHGGIDFKMPVGTPITTKVPIKDITSFYDSKGGGYVQRILFADGLSVDLLHQSEKVKNIKGGSSTGTSKLDGMTSKLDNDYAREAEEARKEQERLAKANRDYLASTAQGEAKIWADVNKTIADLSDKGFTGKSLENETARLKKEAQYDVNLYRETQRQKIVEMSKTHRTQQQIIEDEAYLREVTIMAQHDKTEEQRKQEVLANRAGMMEELRLKDIATKHELNSIWSWRKTSSEAIADEWDEKIDAAINGNSVLKDELVKSLQEQKQLALDNYKLVLNQRLLELNGYKKSEFDFIDKKLELELEAIRLSTDAELIKQARIDAAYEQSIKDRKEAEKKAKEEKAARDSYLFGEDNPVLQTQAALQNEQYQYDDLQKNVFDNMMKGDTSFEDYLTISEDLARQHVSNQNSIMIEGYRSMFSEMSEMVGSFAGKQSAAYKVMFGIEKGFAIAKSVLAIQTAMASATASLPFPANLPVIAQVAMEGAKIISTIKSITSAGFAEGGYTGTGSKYTPAGIVHAGEIVWSQADIKRWGGVDVVERMRKAKGYADGGIVGGKNYMTKVTNDKLIGGNVQVNNYAGVAVTAKQENGLTIVDVRNEVERQMKTQLTNPNSTISKSIYRNSTARPQR